MRLIDEILSDSNIDRAILQVKRNKGVSGVDKMTVDELDEYFYKHRREIRYSILNKKYKPQSVKRVYIPKPNGKKRPLGIPTVVDRVIQQAVAQVLMKKLDSSFSEFSYGFRPRRSAQMAVLKTLEYINEGYDWVIDLDIEAYFDTVNHDKLISILREKNVNDSITLHLIRKFMQAGIMEDGLVKPSRIGVPQGGPLSPILSNVYLDKFDKELEYRGLRFVRYADDCNIFVKSKFLGFTYLQRNGVWKCKPSNQSKMKLYDKCRRELIRRIGIARPIAVTFKRINQIVVGWINYYRIGVMQYFVDTFGQWLRHKIRVIILKQWKKPKRIYINLQKLNKKLSCHFTDEQIFSVANTRLGLYRQANGHVVNFLLSPKILAIKKKDRPGLVNPLNYYLS